LARVRDRVRDRVRVSLRLTLTLNNDYTTLLISRLYCNIYKAKQSKANYGRRPGASMPIK